jgi:hypothetical protein
LRSEWDRAAAQDLFIFEIDRHSKTRTLTDGNLGYNIEVCPENFVSIHLLVFFYGHQLNPSRFEKRRSPYPFDQVNTPFDQSKFNFNKIKNEEVRT